MVLNLQTSSDLNLPEQSVAEAERENLLIPLKGKFLVQKQKITSNRETIERGNLRTGHYVIEIRGGEKIFRGRLVVK